jgi:hypothetical protein
MSSDQIMVIVERGLIFGAGAVFLLIGRGVLRLPVRPGSDPGRVRVLLTILGSSIMAIAVFLAIQEWPSSR